MRQAPDAPLPMASLAGAPVPAPPVLRLTGFGIRICLRSLYRVRVRGGERLPLGPGTLVCSNHVGDADGPLIGVELGLAGATFVVREAMLVPGFLYRYAFHGARWADSLAGVSIDPLARWLGCVPVPARGGRAALAAATSLAERLASGGVVYLAPEGGISASGSMAPFRALLRRLAASARVVVPVHVAYDALARWRPAAYLHIGQALAPPAGNLATVLRRLAPVTPGALLARERLAGEPVAEQAKRLDRLGAWLPEWPAASWRLVRTEERLLRRAAAGLDELEQTLRHAPA